jgi:hypothetical protein
VKFQLALVLCLVPLAGCFGASQEDAGVFSYVAPDDPRNDPFTLSANVAGDRFTWDFGDGRPTVEGAEVAHSFAAHGGSTLVRLTVHDASKVREFDPVRIEIGGANEPPEVAMSLAWDWVQVGEQLVLSGANSLDPNGDELIFSWQCFRDSGIAPKTDDHGPTGSGYGREPEVQVTVTNGIGLPAPSQDVGDFCTAFEAAPRFTNTATVAGMFSQPGIYKLIMLAKDATSATKSGESTIYVTDVPRPETVSRLDVSGNLQLPSVGVVEPDPSGNVVFYDIHNFTVEFDVVGIAIDLTPDGGDPAGNITYDLLRSGEERVAERFTDFERFDDWLKAGQYSLRVFLRSGFDVDYQVNIDLHAELDPSEFWTAPH